MPTTYPIGKLTQGIQLPNDNLLKWSLRAPLLISCSSTQSLSDLFGVAKHIAQTNGIQVGTVVNDGHRGTLLSVVYPETLEAAFKEVLAGRDVQGKIREPECLGYLPAGTIRPRTTNALYNVICATDHYGCYEGHTLPDNLAIGDTYEIHEKIGGAGFLRLSGTQKIDGVILAINPSCRSVDYYIKLAEKQKELAKKRPRFNAEALTVDL